MNVARKLDTKNYTYTNRISKKAVKTNGTKLITLVSKESAADKEVTLDYLNERLAYFYNNGGPIMDI